MPRFKDDDFAERRKTADKAKSAMLERFRARPSDDDPAVVERKAARQAVIEARAERVKAREAAAKQREEEAARAAREQAEREAAERRAEAERAVELLAAQKAARDARYKARKARAR
jgi:hypothetical protein